MKREHDKKTHMLVTTAPEPDREDKIRQRAYEIYEVRGRTPAQAFDERGPPFNSVRRDTLISLPAFTSLFAVKGTVVSFQEASDDRVYFGFLSFSAAASFSPRPPVIPSTWYPI